MDRLTTARSFFQRYSAIALPLLLVACAGYRSGWESLPFVGDEPPAPPEYRTPFEARQRATLALDGLTLGVSLNNQLRQQDKQVYLYVLPLSDDRQQVQTGAVAAGRTRVTLRVTAARDGYVFRPYLAVLGAGGAYAAGVGAAEFGRGPAAGSRPGITGGSGDQPVADAVPLAVGRTYYFTIDFPLPLPSPQSHGISLDLSKALEAPGQRTVVPLIRFKPVRWTEGYT